MTLPDERTNSVMATRTFLRDLLDPVKTPKVPRVVRQRAGWCLRHFPGQVDMEIASATSPRVFGHPST